MRIAFIGDSITEAKPGVSYVDIIARELSEDRIENYGKGGDTVHSLLKRIKKIDNLNNLDYIVLFVGINDVFGKLTRQYRLLKTLTGQRWAKNKEVFTRQFIALIDFLSLKSSKVIVIPPLLVGEDLLSTWNEEVEGLVEIEKLISQDYSNVVYLDVHNKFKNFLSERKQSNYLPKKISVLLDDLNHAITCEEIDKRSKERGLYLTLDGVHINSKGAEIIAKEVVSYMQLSRREL